MKDLLSVTKLLGEIRREDLGQKRIPRGSGMVLWLWLIFEEVATQG